MTTVTLTTSAQQVLGPVAPARKRWVVLQAPKTNSTNLFVKFDGTGDALSTSNGHLMAPGDTLVMQPNVPKSTFGQDFIEAVGASGGEKLVIQWRHYDGI